MHTTAVSPNAFPLPQYTNFTHGLPFPSSSSANTAAWKLEKLEAHVCYFHYSMPRTGVFGCCAMAQVHRKAKKTCPINRDTTRCLWSCHTPDSEVLVLTLLTITAKKKKTKKTVIPYVCNLESNSHEIFKTMLLDLSPSL